MKKIRTILDAEVANIQPNTYAEVNDLFKSTADLFVDEEETINGQKKTVTKKIEKVKCPSDLKAGRHSLIVEIGVNYKTNQLTLKFVGVKGAK